MMQSMAMIYFRIQKFGSNFNNLDICTLLGLLTLIGLKLGSLLMDSCWTHPCQKDRDPPQIMHLDCWIRGDPGPARNVSMLREFKEISS
jgi:hypothetical protein